MFVCLVLRASSVELIGPESPSGEVLLLRVKGPVLVLVLVQSEPNQRFVCVSVLTAVTWLEAQPKELCTSGTS